MGGDAGCVGGGSFKCHLGVGGCHRTPTCYGRSHWDVWAVIVQNCDRKHGHRASVGFFLFFTEDAAQMVHADEGDGLRVVIKSCPYCNLGIRLRSEAVEDTSLVVLWSLIELFASGHTYPEVQPLIFSQIALNFYVVLLYFERLVSVHPEDIGTGWLLGAEKCIEITGSWVGGEGVEKRS